MKELCIDVRMAFHSGIGTYIRHVVPALASHFKLRLICHPDLPSRWPFLQQHELILTSSPIYSVQEQITLPFLVPQCDIFWAPHYNFPLAPIKAKKKVVTIHDIYHVVGPVSFLKRLYAKLIIKKAIQSANHIITVSHFSRAEILKYFPTDKICVIPLATSLSTSSPTQPLLPNRYFLYVGNILPHKNINRLLQAWSLIAKTMPDTTLALVSPSIPKNLPLPPQVTLLHNISYNDLPALYSHAIALIHPSLYEGFGLTLLEAMSCGCPVIASHTASIPEVCHDAALYINPLNPNEIAAAMEKISQNSNTRQELVKKGGERRLAFSWEKTVEAHLKLLTGAVQ
jgi:glycosyltransferase involved in cell wall biosynthesis